MCLPESNVFWISVANICYLILEAWLGKTDKTKSGSVLELIYNIGKSILARKPKE